MKDPIDSLSDIIAAKIKRMNPKETVAEDVMAYALSFILNMVLTIALVLVIGDVFGYLYGALHVLLLFATLRLLHNGYHFKSLTLCVLVTTTFLSIIPLVYLPKIMEISVLCFCVVSVLALRPKAHLANKLLVSAIMVLHYLYGFPHTAMVSLLYVTLLYFKKEVESNGKTFSEIRLNVFRGIGSSSGSDNT